MENEEKIEKEALTDEQSSEASGGYPLFARTQKRCACPTCSELLPIDWPSEYCNKHLGKIVIV